MKNDRSTIVKSLTFLIPLAAVPLVLAAGFLLSAEKSASFLSLAVAVLACVPFFAAFERRGEADAKRLVIISVMTALSVLGRFLFAFIPFFKPVTAIVVITAVYFGPQAGFLCGALSALISNFYFGQGPWTPFQMFAWGIAGFLAGLLGKRLSAGRLRLAAYGIFAGILYSLAMDIWTVLWIDGTFRLTRYLAALAAAAPVTAAYAASNVLFLWIAGKPLGRKLERVRMKYGL